MHAQTVKTVANTIRAAGLNLSLTPNSGLRVAPASAITPELRTMIKVNRDGLVAYLQRVAANEPNDAEHKLKEVSASLFGCDDGMNHTQAQRHSLLHTNYLIHHWLCKHCCAAGQGRGSRCDAGALLWDVYSTTGDQV